MLRFLTQSSTSLVNSLGDLPAPVLGAATGLLGISGAGLAALGTFGSLVPKVREARTALEEMGGIGPKVNSMLGTVGSLAGKASLAFAGFVVLDAVMSALDPDVQVVTHDIGQLSTALQRFGDTGKSTGELATMFGNTAVAADNLVVAMSAVRQIPGWMADIRRSTPGWLFDVTGNSMGKTLIDKQVVAFDQLKQNVKDVDTAMAGLVSSGHADAAAAAANRLLDAWVAQGHSIDEFKKDFPQLDQAMGNYQASSTTTISTTGEITTGLGEAKTAADLLKAAFDSLNGIQLTQAEAQVSYTEALKGIKIAADDGTKGLDLNTLAGAQNASQLIQTAQQADALAQAIGNTSGVDAGTAALGRFRAEIIQQAKHAGLDAAQVQALIDKIFKVPANTPTTINLHDKATPGIAAVDDYLNRINGKTSTVVLTTIQRTISQLINATPIGMGPMTGQGGIVGLPAIPHRAAGGPVAADQTYLVGEHGPELVRMGGTGFVTPADLTAQTFAAYSHLIPSQPSVPAHTSTSTSTHTTTIERHTTYQVATGPSAQETARWIRDNERDEAFLRR